MRSPKSLTALTGMAAVLALGLAACGGGGGAQGTTTTTTGATSTAAKALRIGLAFDVGGRGDGTFNDLAVKGLEKAKADFGAQSKELSPKEDGSDRPDLLRQLADDGYNPIIGVGFSYSQPLGTVAKEYPDVQFIGIDTFVADEVNVANDTFAEHEGSFLVGVAAALKSKSNHIGFIGGNESALITKFWAGYKQGAMAVKPDIKIDEKRLAAGESGAGFGDTAGAKVAAQAMYQAGADVVYTAAGGSFAGSFPAAVEAGAGHWAIGVDSDQYNTVTDPAQKKIILTSMVKRVDSAVYASLKSFKETGKVVSTAYGLQDNGVGYSTSGGFVDDIKSQLESYRQKILDGTLRVSETVS
ncbi:MAG TPA: BMP family ABC transporter substrate-binding protein [Dermatophilaceae bacterium]|nr:BMP family ABC transporter substrate-binding protein [Dermatophilaceae bacterium]